MKFRAHDTFFIRKGWLSKGMKAVQTKPDVFVAKDENPMDVLGIGSNMVKALRYWLVATNLTEEAIQNKKRIQKFTGFWNTGLQERPLHGRIRYAVSFALYAFPKSRGRNCMVFLLQRIQYV